MTNSDYEPVVFENSLGEIISNDPVFLARQTLEAAGMTIQQAVQQAPESRPDDSEENLGDDNTETPEDYKGFKGPELKKLAELKGVDISSFTKVGEVRAALVQADLDAKAAAEIDAANAQ